MILVQNTEAGVFPPSALLEIGLVGLVGQRIDKVPMIISKRTLNNSIDTIDLFAQIVVMIGMDIPPVFHADVQNMFTVPVIGDQV